MDKLWSYYVLWSWWSMALLESECLDHFFQEHKHQSTNRFAYYGGEMILYGSEYERLWSTKASSSYIVGPMIWWSRPLDFISEAWTGQIWDIVHLHVAH